MTYYQIDDKIYYLNLDAVFGMVTNTPNNEKPVNTTITQVYGHDEDDNEIGGGKEIVETKSNLNDTMNNVRYDLVKNLIFTLLSISYDDDGTPRRVFHLSDLSFAQGLSFNTLIEYNFLQEIETDNE